MTYTMNGSCPKCGSPTWLPTIWMSVLPPPTHYTCNCFPTAPKTYYTTNTCTFDNKINPLDNLFNELKKEGMVEELPVKKFTPPSLEQSQVQHCLQELEKLKKRVSELEKENNKLKTIKKLLND